MIYVFFSKLNDNEVEYLKRMLEIAGAEYYSIKSLDEPAGEVLLNDHVFVVHEETKNKSVVQKKFESIYGSRSYTRIDRPNLLAQFKEQIETTVGLFRDCFQGVKNRQIAYSVLPKIDNDILTHIYETCANNTSFILETADKSLKIVPNDTMNRDSNSITFTEFFIMYAAKQVFKFDKIIVSEMK